MPQNCHPDRSVATRTLKPLRLATIVRKPLLPGGNRVPTLVCSSVQHVDTSGVHMLGHLEDLVEFVVQGRLASRSRQRIVTRSQSKFVCTHNEYWYTSARAQRKCVNHTITRPRRGQRPSPLGRPLGYPGGSRMVSLPVKDRYLQQNRWRIGLAALITKVVVAA